MTPKEKATELIVKMSTHDRDVHPHFTHYIAKQCALIAVDEILKALPEDYQNDIWSYWQEVKKEIEKI
jgi:hypothetical protein